MSRPLAGYGSALVGSEVALKRKILRKSFRSNNVTATTGDKFISRAGPFRASISAGDPLGRKYQTCGGFNQVHDVNIRIRLGQDGVSNNSCNTITDGVTPLQLPLESGNSKYVHDSSLFTRFKTLSSVNQNFNDISFGGNKHNGSYEAIMRVRRS
jgi:hypothetical protein